MELGIPVIMAINMMDLVEKNGDKIHIDKLSKKLGCEVVEISALKGTGIQKAAEKAVALAQQKKNMVPVHEFSKDAEDVITDCLLYTSGKSILWGHAGYQIYRAPTDNDIQIKEKWKEAGYDAAMTKVYHSDAFCLDGEAHYVADIGIAAIYRQPAVHLHADWCVNRWGCLLYTSRCV